MYQTRGSSKLSNWAFWFIERLRYRLLQRQRTSFSPGRLEGRLIELSAHKGDHTIYFLFVVRLKEGS